jgi:hypothetical protein
MSRQFVVKTWDGTKYNISMNPSENYNDFVRKLETKVGLEEGKIFKFVSKGKIMNEQNFPSFESGLVLALLGTKSVETVSQSNTNQKSQSQTQTQDDPLNPSYAYKNIKAATIVFLDWVRNNPQMSDLYTHNYTQFVTEVIKNPTVDMIFRNILSQSNQILSSMEKGENLRLNIGGSEGNQSVEKIELTKEDQENINELIDMGFDPTLVLKTYIENNNNKDRTLEKLLA